MTAIISATGLSKAYRGRKALDNVSFSVGAGRIVGLIGRNGAGKTTALKAILGLTTFEGELRVLGKNPATERDELMREVSFIADTAVLPKWLRVRNALDYMQGVHPNFRTVAHEIRVHARCSCVTMPFESSRTRLSMRISVVRRNASARSRTKFGCTPCM